jgi:hypothetical protein
MRGADHAEQRVRCGHPVEDPVSVEDLVAAVLRVRLRKHRQLDVRRVASDTREEFGEIVDLVGRQRQTERPVGFLERRTPVAHHVDIL